jgi:hypothetical protein
MAHVYRMIGISVRMAHTRVMALLTEPDRRTPTTFGAVPIGVALVVAELLLALLWYPWVVDHLVFSSSLPYGVLRLLIVAPEYALLAVAVHLVGLTQQRRVSGAGVAVAAGLVVWGVSVVQSHLIHTRADLRAHHTTASVLSWFVLLAAPTLATLAWGLARRHGRWWLVAVPLAPALHWWIEHTDWVLRFTLHLSFRVGEAYGMALVIAPVLLAVLACWALEQAEHARTPPDR